MTKKDVLSLVLILILSFLYIILLDESYQTALNSLMLLFGILPILIGINNSFHYLKISIGITRKEIANKYIVDLLYTILLGAVYLLFVNLFAFLVYDEVYIPFSNVVLETIFLYTLSIFISSFIMYIYNMFYSIHKKFKNILLICIVILVLILILLLYVYLYIKILYLIGIIISLVLFIIFVLVNNFLTIHKKM